KSAKITGISAGVSTITVSGSDGTNTITASCNVTVIADMPSDVSITSIKVKGATDELLRTDTDVLKSVFAIVPANATIVVASKAVKGENNASNTKVEWTNGSTKIEDKSASTEVGSSIEVATGTTGTITLKGAAAADESVTRDVTLYVAPKLDAQLESDGIVAVTGLADATYTGAAVTPAISVSFRNNAIDAANYEVKYDEDTVNAGTKSATITAKSGGIFTAADTGKEIKKTYTVAPAKLSDIAITLSNENIPYTGSEQTPVVASATFNNGAVTIPAADLVLIDGKGTNVGTYTAKFQAISDTTTAKNFEGTATKEYKIAAGTISGVSLSATSFTYNGSKQVPTVNSTTLKEGTDFEATIPTTSTNAGDYTVTVTGKGNYAGTETLKYTIKAATLTNKLVSLNKTSVTYNGKNQNATLKTSLKSGTDYTASIPNSKNVASYTVKVTGKGNYTGTLNLAYKITQAANPLKLTKNKGSVLVTKTTLKVPATGGQGTVTYTSKSPKVATVNSSGKITALKPGTAKISVSAKGNTNYKKSGTLTYTVTVTKLAKPTNVKLASSKKKQLTVSWKKVSNATGYRVLYSTNKNMKNAKSTKDIKTTKTTLKSLSSGKTYYVQVRAYVKKYSTNNLSDASSKVSKKVK
ncbi:MAG: fibronectin type III domain-containing protein, partial [Lachnospiraceae bacterium]|nr:fibronectin type III domain-containing protein [Lachnospiraceae bacterium]